MPVIFPPSPETCEALLMPINPRPPIYLRDVYFCVFLIWEGLSPLYFFY